MRAALPATALRAAAADCDDNYLFYDDIRLSKVYDDHNRVALLFSLLAVSLAYP
jgi:hypothetical protein